MTTRVTVRRDSDDGRDIIDCAGEILGFVCEERPNSTFRQPPVYAIYAADDSNIHSVPISRCKVLKEHNIVTDGEGK